MFDFTYGTTWFLSGLGVTLFLVAVLMVFLLFARRVDHR